MDDQINRTILDNFDVSSVENVQHEIYKMNGSEVLKGLENGSLHFITVPREEFIDHTLLPEYITTHGFIIDTMLDSTDGSNNEPSHQSSSFVTHHSTPQTLTNANEIQLQSNLDESDRRLNAALFQIVKSGNIRIGGSSNTETQVIVTNKDLVNLSGTQVTDTSLKNENSNSLDTSTFLTFDDQQSLTNSLINDGQFRIFQQPSSNTHQQTQLHNISINSINNPSLPQLAPIKRLNRNSKNSISLNITDTLNIDNLKHNGEIEQIQNFQQRPAAKKVLPHKKRITKKLKSIDVNQRVEHLFQQSDNSSRSTSNQIQFFPDINSDEVININQFSCQICGSNAESQLEFFSHLKQHYEPKTERTEISQIEIRDEVSFQKEFLSHQTQSDQHIQVSVNHEQLPSQFQQLPQIKRPNHQQLQQEKSHRNHSLSPMPNETTEFKSTPQIHQNTDIHNHQSTVHNTQSEQAYLITNKKGVETRDLSNVTNFTFENFPSITSLTGHAHVTHTAITKDMIEAPHGYDILDTSMENHLRSGNSHQIQIPKSVDFLNLQAANEQQISLTSRALLNPTEVESKIMLEQQQKNSILNNSQSKSQHSQQILQNNSVYSQSTLQNNSEVEQNIFANTQYFETKFTGLPNQVLNLEQKIDAIRAENDISHSICDRTNNIIKSESLVQSSICQTPTCLSNEIHLTNSQSVNDIDGTENINPSIGQLHDETIQIHSNSQKSSTNDIVILQRDEVEFSDPEDMLEGIRGVVDKVQESFDTGDEMEPMSPQRTNWFPNTVLNGEINSKSNINSTDSSFQNTNSVENFQIFFKNDENNDNKEQPNNKFNSLCNEVVLEQRKTISNANNISNIINNKNNSNSLISTDNSLASSTTNTVPLNSGIEKNVSIKMEHFSSDFDDSWSREYDKDKNIDNQDNDKLSTFSNSRESSPFDKRTDSPSSMISEKEVLKDCGVLSGKKGKKKYFCEKCFKVFNSLNALKYHEFAHSGERPFPCDKCDKSFFAQNALRTHQRVHSGEKPFTCVECGRAFRQWGDLNYHKTSLHSNEKNFQCEFCGKAFSRKYSLVIHRRIHTQEKNYKCEFCPKTFRASSYLQNHRKIHTGEKPYVCLTCNKKFRVCGDLKRHQKIHERKTNAKTTFQVNENLSLEKKENQSISLDNVVTIRLPDTVINIQTEDLYKKTKSNKKQTDLNSSVFMYSTSDNNLDQLFKTDNINTNNVKNISSTLPVNIIETNFIKNDDSDKKLIQSSSSSLPPTALSSTVKKGATTYIITEVGDKCMANKKVLTKFRNKKIRELVM